MIRKTFETTGEWLEARHGIETGSKLPEEAELEQLFDFDTTQDMRADERGHYMENVYATLHPKLYHSDNEIFYSGTDKKIAISPDFLDDENNPKVAVELKCYGFSEHYEFYKKFLAGEDIFKPKTARRMNDKQRRLLHQVQHYFRVFEGLETVELTMFSPFAKDKNMREFKFIYDKEIMNYGKI